MFTKFIWLFVSALAMLILSLNLPPNNINNNLKLKTKSSLLDFVAIKLITSQTVANWEYKDFIFVKFACSETLKTEMIAIPFQQWSVSYMPDGQFNGKSPIICKFNDTEDIFNLYSKK